MINIWEDTLTQEEQFAVLQALFDGMKDMDDEIIEERVEEDDII